MRPPRPAPLDWTDPASIEAERRRLGELRRQGAIDETTLRVGLEGLDAIARTRRLLGRRRQGGPVGRG